VTSFVEVVDMRPSLEVAVVHAPIGYLDRRAASGRTCEREARRLLGRHGSAVRHAPSRDVLEEDAPVPAEAADHDIHPYREVAREMSPYRQRVVYEGHPELSFYNLNHHVPLEHPRETPEGDDERVELVRRRVPNAERLFDDVEFDAAPLADIGAMLWTARRVLARVADRIPAQAEWDSQGLRMEIVH
jgi:predicted RNase H-like nuclease